jgi:hypothetical protein
VLPRNYCFTWFWLADENVLNNDRVLAVQVGGAFDVVNTAIICVL